MASEIDIVNLALANLSNEASVTSISPPEGSVEAEHAARFYPIARDLLLEKHPWNFATKRKRLSAVTETGDYADGTEWDYVYAMPNDCVTVLAIISEGNSDDYSRGSRGYTPQPYQIEVLGDDSIGIRTDVEDAEIRFTSRVENTNHFSPSFVFCLSWLLASMLAGPILRGEVGLSVGIKILAIAEQFIANAEYTNSKQREIKVKHQVPWINERN